ncbi:hypothetical protein J6590_045764 [Homalodisca vitripennis]|nr:hypothetical protein J6590_045764 [Homalodisca vitripennis]
MALVYGLASCNKTLHTDARQYVGAHALMYRIARCNKTLHTDARQYVGAHALMYRIARCNKTLHTDARQYRRSCIEIARCNKTLHIDARSARQSVGAHAAICDSRYLTTGRPRGKGRQGRKCQAPQELS